MADEHVMTAKDCIDTMRLKAILAQWSAASDILILCGRDLARATATIREMVGHGITGNEADLLIEHAEVLHKEAAT